MSSGRPMRRIGWEETLKFASPASAAASKAIMLGLIILATANFFVSFEIAHPFVMLFFLLLTGVAFAMLGFIIGIWADSFEKLQIVPLLIVTPLAFLGGTFYSISMLPPIWQKITLIRDVEEPVNGGAERAPAAGGALRGVGRSPSNLIGKVWLSSA